MGNDDVGFEDLEETDILCPKAVAWRPTKLTQDGQYCGNVSGSVRVPRVAGDAYETILGNCTGRPGPFSLFRKPAMSRFMMDVHRIGQGKKQIDVEKVGRHGISSRRRLTCFKSGLRRPWAGPGRAAGRPLSIQEPVVSRPAEPSSESTRPRVMPRFTANSLAAKRTSSSRSTVVRMVSSQWLRVESIHLMLDATASQIGGQEVKIRKSGMTI